jgi:hypothetical protein
MIATTKRPDQTGRAQHDQRFLELVPAIERYARLTFRNLKQQEREEAICAVVAGAFCAYRRLVELGKQDVAYATPLARFAAARYRVGRYVGNRLNMREVCCRAAQRRRGFRLLSLSSTFSSSDSWEEALADDTLTPIPDQVAFRMDFSAWLRRLNRRERKLATFLALGNTPSAAAQRFRVSRARVSQMRIALQANWQAFQGEALQCQETAS